MLTYDGPSARWWQQLVENEPSSWAGTPRATSRLSDELASFCASLNYRLAPLAASGADGVARLWNDLEAAYPAGRLQLALLFSLLDEAQQPAEAMRRAIGGSNGGSPAADASIGAAAAALSSSPTALLPPSAAQLLSSIGPGYSLPLPLRELLSSGALGAVARAPVSRELALSPEVYRLFALSGGFGCALTHLVVVPLDVVKTRIQTRPGAYSGFADAFTRIREDEGLGMLMQGAAPTGAGYWMYGVCVYPLFELSKRSFFELAGEAAVLEWRTPLVLAAGAVATFFTCFAISPFETVRIRVVECPSYAANLPEALQRYLREGGVASLYDGIIPLLVRQILFGMVKFLIFDTAADAISAALPPAVADDPVASLGVSLLSGAIAGVAAAIVSQPADVVLSKVAQGGGSSKTEEGRLPGNINQVALLQQAARQISRKFGPTGFFLGLPSRCLWSGAIIGGQFLLYDVFKTLLHVTHDELHLFYDALGASAAFIAPQ
jgi:solute carrier family 25 phosphate transporter 3